MHGSLALGVALERHTLDEAVQEVLNDNELGIGLGGLSKGVVVSLSSGNIAGLENVLWELVVSHGWLVHDGLERHILVLGSGECLYPQLDILQSKLGFLAVAHSDALVMKLSECLHPCVLT